jgi:DNA-binding beta-propeller fold protein YncE
MLRTHGFIPIPGVRLTSFDHGAADERTGRVFVAHTAADSVEVFDGRQRRHERTLPGHTEAAGVVVGEGLVAVTNRGAASLSLIDAATLNLIATFSTAPRPNGIALAPRSGVVVAACLGTDASGPALVRIEYQTGSRRILPLPGRPRWCVVDPVEGRVFCAIQDPSSVLVVELAGFTTHALWPLPSSGAHGADLDSTGGRLFVACDGGSLVALTVDTGAVVGQWPLPGVPDATFFNPATGRVHVAVGDPGVVVSVDPQGGRQMVTPTEAGAKTTALGPPDRLFVFLPTRGGALELIDQPA